MARYINADKAMEIITEVIHDTVSENADVVASEVEYAFDSMPTADVRENVHGHWIRSDWNGANIRYTCSRCQLSIVTNEDYIKKHRFCFACGAIMDEVVE